MAECDRIGLYKFAGVAFELEIIFGVAHEWNWSSIDGSALFLLWKCLKELAEGDLFDGGCFDVGDEWEDGRASYFGYVFIVFGGSEEVIAVAGGEALWVRAVGAGVGVGFVAPVRVVGVVEEVAHVFGVPGVAVAAPCGLLREEAGPFGEGGLLGGVGLAIILISAHAT
jgi:hypothetical protein